MSVNFDFAPSPGRAAELNRLMHLNLALSLRHICDRSRDIVDFDERALSALIGSLERGEVYEAATFSYYYDLVRALLRGDEETVSSMFGALAAAQPITSGLRVLALGDKELGVKSDRYQRLMDSNPSLPLGFLPPSCDLAASFRDRLHRGLELLERAVPDLAGEVREIINEIVIVAGDSTKKFQFDGGSHFQLWGALFLNAEFHKTDHAIVEVIAHESAHSLLFGFCTEEALVENSDDELFTSPLRPDARPMDGIYHATFVSARMHWAMSRLLASGLLDADAREAATAAVDADARNFEAGYAVVAEHARLTSTGSALMSSARAYMDGIRV
jgi:hypothetical protein